MSNAKSSWSKLSMIGFAVAALAIASVPMHAQEQNVPAVHSGYTAITGVPQDWTHHHLVFSNPGSEESAIKAGKYNEWLSTVHDPRYVMQQMRRGAAAQGPSADDVAARKGFSSQSAPAIGINPVLGSRTPVSRFSKPSFQTSPLKKDWNTNLYTSAIMPNTFPAKYSFSTTGTPSCANDFVVYPTGATGATASATIVAYNNIYPGTAAPGCLATSPETVYWAYNTGTAAVTTSPALSADGSEIAFIQSNGTTASLVLLKWKANNGTLTAAIAPTSVTAANFLTCTAPCMFTAALSGTPNDTYSSPFYDFTYDSLYVGDNAGNLHKFTGVFGGTPTEATPVTLNATATVASPVFDVNSGCVFVGDSLGFLYSVNSGHAGTVCTNATFGLNATSEQLGDGAAAEGIYDGVLVDSTAGKVYAFVADAAAVGGHTATISLTFHSTTFDFTGTSVTAADIGSTITATGLTAGTTITAVDTATNSGTLSVRANNTETNETATIGVITTAGDEAVLQFPTNFGAAAAPSDGANLGTGGANYWVFSGSFDNTYYSSATPATPSGNLYVIGNNGGDGATLYRVPITSNAVGTPVTTTVGSGFVHGWGSPVTEFYNTSTTVDSIYFSVNRGSVTGCTNATGDGCIIAYTVTSGAAVLAGATNFTYPGTNGCWGTSAFIIDNGTSSTDTSNVYFEWFGGDSPSTAPTTCTAATTHTTGAYSESQGTAF